MARFLPLLLALALPTRAFVGPAHGPARRHRAVDIKGWEEDFASLQEKFYAWLGGVQRWESSNECTKKKRGDS